MSTSLGSSSAILTPETAIEHLTIELGQASAYGTTFGFLMVRFGNLRAISEAMGEKAKDQALAQSLARLGRSLREGDSLARFGNDTYGVMLPGLLSYLNAEAVAKRLVQALTLPLDLADASAVVNVSIGLAAFPVHADTAQDLLQVADVALGRAESRGISGYEVYAVRSDALKTERLEMEAELRGALERNEFSLHYQPQISGKTGLVVGAEALLRWQNRRFGSVSPASFIPIAESSGEIDAIGLWVLETACHDLVRWNRDPSRRFEVAVNVSPRQLAGTALVEALERLILDLGFDSSLLTLEITENSVVQRTTTTLSVIDALESLGVRLALDDFGTGYASLAYLQLYNFDVLKIDQSFLRNVPDDRKSTNIARTMIGLGRDLGLEVLAEGVETEQQRAFLADCGCDFLQGFLFSKPVPTAQFEATFLAPARASFDAMRRVKSLIDAEMSWTRRPGHLSAA